MNTTTDACYYAWRDALVIAPLKNASSSVRRALHVRAPLKRADAEMLNGYLRTIAIIRHPFDRAVSALFSIVTDGVGHRDLLECWRSAARNMHLHPQHPAFDGLRVDHWIEFGRLDEQWEQLGLPPRQHIGKSERPAWKGLMDWSEPAQFYARDFELWPAWDRQ